MSENEYKFESFAKLEVCLHVGSDMMTASLELPNVYEDWEINVNRGIGILSKEVITKFVEFKKMGKSK